MAKDISVKVDRKLHTRLKNAAKQDGRLLGRILEEAIAAWLERRSA